MFERLSVLQCRRSETLPANIKDAPRAAFCGSYCTPPMATGCSDVL